jgi:hypothetical protein
MDREFWSYILNRNGMKIELDMPCCAGMNVLRSDVE